LRLLGNAALATMGGWYHALWERQLDRVLEPAPLVHFLLHGNCRRALARVQARGSRLLAEAVNSHPEDYRRLIDGEFADLGLAPPARNRRAEEQILAEISLADRLLVPSQFVERSYLARGFPAGRMTRIGYGANLQDFRPGPERDGHRWPFRVICCGLVTPRKGPHHLLRAWKQLTLPDAELHFFGQVDREIMPRLLAIGAANAHFHGSVDRATLIRELQGSDLFVLPTVEDGFGVVILEAMACGLPVITTENSGGPDVITDGQEGFVVPVRSAGQLAEKIGRLYRDRELARAMGRAARQRVETRPDWRGYAGQLIAHYAECLKP
jgi:glycosyltransferase involved in cell wall biosynthesis